MLSLPEVKSAYTFTEIYEECYWIETSGYMKNVGAGIPQADQDKKGTVCQPLLSPCSCLGLAQAWPADMNWRASTDTPCSGNAIQSARWGLNIPKYLKVRRQMHATTWSRVARLCQFCRNTLTPSLGKLQSEAFSLYQIKTPPYMAIATQQLWLHIETAHCSFLRNSILNKKSNKNTPLSSSEISVVQTSCHF